MSDNNVRVEKGCFIAGTLISTSYGFKCIEDISVGDFVLSFNDRGIVEEKQVTEIFVHTDTYDIVRDIFWTGGKFSPTENHYILVIDNNTYTEARYLKVGDKIKTAGGKWVVINNIGTPYQPKVTYNFTVADNHTYIADGIRVHNKGGGKGGSAHVPVEADDSLFSRATAIVVDGICEGEINDIKAVYLDEVDSSAYLGLTLYKRYGLVDQTHVPGIPSQGSEVAVQTEVTYENPVQKSITDDSVDDVRLTIYVPALMATEDDNDIIETSVSLNIYVNNILAKEVTISGKTTSGYQRAVRIRDLNDHYGPAPWIIKVVRTTEDSDSLTLTNNTIWTSYTQIKNIKMKYPDTALVAIKVDAKQFGDRIPHRTYEIEGLKIQVPNNWDGGLYPGEWDGTYVQAYCTNPVWCIRDLLLNKRYGLGRSIDEVMIDDANFYGEAQYCDQLIDDGNGGYHSRYSFDGVISNRSSAPQILNLMATNCNAMIYQSAGKIRIVIDRPRDPSMIVGNANVENGEFIYEGTDLASRYTVANVSYSDINDFSKPAVETVEDFEAMKRYGRREIDIDAYGCNNRTRANRYGKWAIYTSCYQNQKISYTSGLDCAALTPGDIIIVMDENYTLIPRQGRVVAATSSTVTLDRPVDLNSGETYTLYTTDDDGQVTTKTITSVGAGLTIISISGSFTDIPDGHTMWLISGSDVAARQYRVLSVEQVESSNKFTVSALFHDPNKYQIVEEEMTFDPIPYTNIPPGPIEPPTSLVLEEHTYLDGQNWLNAVMISWGHSPDARRIRYDVQVRTATIPWYNISDTASCSFDFKNVVTETYTFRVRTIAANGASEWLTSAALDVLGVPNKPAPPENLRCMDSDGEEFYGKDCEITWDAPDITTFSGISIDRYVVKVLDSVDATLYRQVVIEKEDRKYIYDYLTNLRDHDNIATRNIRFAVLSVNYAGVESDSAYLEAVNYAPDFSSMAPDLTARPSYLQVQWDPSSDKDIDKYVVYYATSLADLATMSGTAASGIEVAAPCTYAEIHGLSYGETYYVSIEPWDVFGVGTKSQYEDGNTLLIPNINIDQELQDSIVITDSIGTLSTTLSGLYDGTWNTGGVLYTASGTNDYIQYAYKIENYFDRVGIWTNNASGHVYLAASQDEVDWIYFKPTTGHTLNEEYELVKATNEADAEINYWQMKAGLNVGILPNNITAKYMRLYITGNGYSTNIHEFVPSRMLISELAAIQHLSAISSNIGTIIAGMIQSADYDGESGQQWNLDLGTFRGAITFLQGSSGYSGALSDIDNNAAAKLDGIEDGATAGGSDGSNMISDPYFYKEYTTASGSYWEVDGVNAQIQGSVGEGSKPCLVLNGTGITASGINKPNSYVDTIDADTWNVKVRAYFSNNINSGAELHVGLLEYDINDNYLGSVSYAYWVAGGQTKDQWLESSSTISPDNTSCSKAKIYISLNGATAGYVKVQYMYASTLSSLSDVDSEAGAKLNGIEDGATAGATFGVNVLGGSTTGGYVNNDGTFNLSTNGNTYINGDQIIVRDAASNIRVILGLLN